MRPTASSPSSSRTQLSGWSRNIKADGFGVSPNENRVHLSLAPVPRETFTNQTQRRKGTCARNSGTRKPLPRPRRQLQGSCVPPFPTARPQWCRASRGEAGNKGASLLPSPSFQRPRLASLLRAGTSLTSFQQHTKKKFQRGVGRGLGCGRQRHRAQGLRQPAPPTPTPRSYRLPGTSSGPG